MGSSSLGRSVLTCEQKFVKPLFIIYLFIFDSRAQSPSS